jgi:hypothetical protein
MKFWDASAIVPLCCREQSTMQLRTLLRSDRDLVVWWSTLVECHSAIERLVREKKLGPSDQLKAMRALGMLEARWIEVEAGDLARQQALRALKLHNLRTGDALQLGAALVWAQLRPRRREFVCLDARLREAAAIEGFTVLP